MAEHAFTPYAQAAAVVDRDGTVVSSKGVTEVKRVSAGDYRVTVDEGTNVEYSIPIAALTGSANWRGEIFVDTATRHTFRVQTGVNGAYSDQPFHVIVP